MLEQNKKIVSFYGYPVTTLLVVGALLTFSSQSLSSMLLYERSSILSGEIWRLVTGHLVHFSKGHLLLDLVCIAVAGWIIETRRYPMFGLMCVVSALVVGLVSLLLLPDMYRYGGLSAIGISAITYLCLLSLKENASQRWIYLMMLFVTGLKIISEVATGEMLFASIDGSRVVPVPLAHFAGMVVGALFFILEKTTRKHDFTTWPNKSLNNDAR